MPKDWHHHHLIENYIVLIMIDIAEKLLSWH